MGRPRSRQRPVAARESGTGTDLRVAINNLELAERRLTDGRAGSLSESVTDLEQRLIDPGWRLFTAAMTQEFSDAGRQQMRDVCRLMVVASPLLKRGADLRSAYVHGGGCQHTARANGHGHDGEQDVQAAVSAFLTDDGNARSFTGPAARDRLEHTLASDGEFFVALITRPLTGEVQTRVVLADEIADIIHNPEDRSEPWYYKRQWIKKVYGPDGSTSEVQQTVMHPCVDYRPANRPKTFAGAPVAWDKPMLHVNVGRPEHWQHGVPDVYSAIPWARAYKIFLEQWASLVAALSKFAWRTTADGSRQARQVRSAIAAAAPRFPGDGDPNTVGQTAITGAGHTLEAIPKSGATIDSESGRPLAMMVAAALGVPVTMLLGDPGLTGARATAETLDLPTELTMGQRREVWTAADQRILRYVIAEAVRAPRGPLKGKITRDRFRDRELVELAGDTDDTIDIVWPDLSDTTVKEKVDAVVSANATGTIPPEIILRMLLAALGARDVDTIVEALMKDGKFQWPAKPGGAAAQPSEPGDANGDAPDAPAPIGDGENPDPLTEAHLREAGQQSDARSAAVAALLATWPALTAPLIDGLTEDVTAVIESGDLAALSTVAARPATVRALTEALSQAMTGVAGRAVDETVADAAAQGVAITASAADTDRLRDVATAVAGLIATGYSSAAVQAALGTPLAEAGRIKTAISGAAAAVRTALSALGSAMSGLVVTQVGAAMQAAEHEGIRAVFEAYPPEHLVADEDNDDHNRCAACKENHGHEYDSLEEALADYPLVGYVHCAGTALRCRGRLRGRWA